MSRIDEIRTRLNNATEGPWLNDGNAVKTREDAVYGYPPSDGVICGLDDGEYIENKNCRNDAEFIANAPTDISYLLSIIDRYRDALEGIAGQITSSTKIADDMRDMAQIALELNDTI